MEANIANLFSFVSAKSTPPQNAVPLFMMRTLFISAARITTSTPTRTSASTRRCSKMRCVWVTSAFGLSVGLQSSVRHSLHTVLYIAASYDRVPDTIAKTVGARAWRHTSARLSQQRLLCRGLTPAALIVSPPVNVSTAYLSCFGGQKNILWYDTLCFEKSLVLRPSTIQSAVRPAGPHTPVESFQPAPRLAVFFPRVITKN